MPGIAGIEIGFGGTGEVSKVNPELLPCFKCGKAAMTDQFGLVYDSVTLASRGGFGSTVWNPQEHDESFIQLNICDDCLREGAKAGLVAVGKPAVVRTPITYKVFSPVPAEE